MKHPLARTAAAALGCMIAVLVTAAAAVGGPAMLRAHRVYGGLTSKKSAYVVLRTGTARVILASPANTAPELLHSNINFSCPGHGQVNPGMVAMHLKLSGGRYSFSAHFVRKGVEEFPGTHRVTLTVDISGVVANATRINGKVAVHGSADGCNLPKQSFVAKLLPKHG